MEKPLTMAEASATFTMHMLRLVAQMYDAVRFRKTAAELHRRADLADDRRQQLRREVTG